MKSFILNNSLLLFFITLVLHLLLIVTALVYTGFLTGLLLILSIIATALTITSLFNKACEYFNLTLKSDLLGLFYKIIILVPSVFFIIGYVYGLALFIIAIS